LRYQGDFRLGQARVDFLFQLLDRAGGPLLDFAVTAIFARKAAAHESAGG